MTVELTPITLNSINKEEYSIFFHYICESLKQIHEAQPELHYHGGLDHSLLVHEQALLLSDMEGLLENQRNLAGILAIGHDLGFFQQYLDNEPFGVDAMVFGMRNFGSLQKFIGDVEEPILSTNLNYTPKTLIAKILRDADLSAIGRKDFPLWAARLRKEWLDHPEVPNELNAIANNDHEFYQLEHDFINHHQWQTRSAERLYGLQFARNKSAVNSKPEWLLLENIEDSLAGKYLL